MTEHTLNYAHSDVRPALTTRTPQAIQQVVAEPELFEQPQRVEQPLGEQILV